MTEAVGLGETTTSVKAVGDCMVVYISKFREYGLPIHDGGSSFLQINYCPWCGTALPDSLRERWFKELEALGFDDPLFDQIPEEYSSEDWYRGG